MNAHSSFIILLVILAPLVHSGNLGDDSVGSVNDVNGQPEDAAIEQVEEEEFLPFQRVPVALDVLNPSNDLFNVMGDHGSRLVMPWLHYYVTRVTYGSEMLWISDDGTECTYTDYCIKRGTEVIIMGLRKGWVCRYISMVKFGTEGCWESCPTPLAYTTDTDSAVATQYTQYGKTPNVIRRIRAARADIGDMGRGIFMHDSDIARLPYLLDARVDKVYELFSSFISEFNIEDYSGSIQLLDEDYEILESKLRFPLAKSYYDLKMFMQIEKSFKNEEESTSNKFKKFEVNLSHVRAYNELLYSLLVKYPADCISELDRIVHSFFQEILNHYFKGSGVVVDSLKIGWMPRVRLFGKPNVDLYSNLDPSDIDSLVCLKGTVLRASTVSPEITMAAFKCTGTKKVGLNATEKCTHEVYEYVIQGEVNEPLLCPQCKSRNSFTLWHNMCCFASKQLIKLLEISDTDSPQSITLYAYDDNIDEVNPGDKVEVTGIYKTSAIRINQGRRSCQSVYRTFINVINFKKEVNAQRIQIQKLSGAGSDTKLNFSSELVAKILELAKSDNLYQLLVDSFAPSIEGRDDVKRGLLCQLFGASQDPQSKMRSQINILLCGDPSTAKSQLLKYVHMLVPRGVYTSGKGSSQVGLTAYVRKDPDTHEYILESGAVVLSDNGICCIDEFDKMDESARAILHEVMEQQTVTVAKAGIVATLNARTAILASANPKNSRYDKKRAVVENINLPPSLFSRFDLIYLVLDYVDATQDREIATKICNTFSMDDTTTPPIPPELLAKYISFARAHCNPYLITESREILIAEYLKMRSGEGGTGARQLEALIRLSQALAKMRLCVRVEASDALEAVRLMRISTFQSLIDPSSGKIDFDQLVTGYSVQELKRRGELKEQIMQTLHEASAGMDKIMERLRTKDKFLEKNLVDNLLTELEQEGKVHKSNQGYSISRL